MKLLLTGVTGKVGQSFLPTFLTSDRFKDWDVLAFCNNRTIDESERVKVIRGSISDPAAVSELMSGVTHVLHMAAVKESPEDCVDVAIKGMFLLLEACRQSKDLSQFILIGGDCSVGHAFQFYPGPITEDAPRRAYPGCYALTKVIEETMLEQYQVQYGLNGCILRAPWIMEKDDFRCALSFGENQFGGPPWTDFMSSDEVARRASEGVVPKIIDRDGNPLKRNFVHIDDLVQAILAALGNPYAHQQLFNISMNEPVDYGTVAEYLDRTRGIKAMPIPTPLYSNWLDNAKARQVLDWRPSVDTEGLIERAWEYQRSDDDPRRIWYPG